MITCLSFLSLRFKVRDSPALFKTNRGNGGVRLLRMCALIVLVLAICWFRNQIYCLRFKFDLTKMETPVHQFTVVSCMGNSTLTPFIYYATKSTYMKHFLTLLCREKKDYSTNEISSEAKRANKITCSTSVPLSSPKIPKVKTLTRNEYDEYYARSVEVLQG